MNERTVVKQVKSCKGCYVGRLRGHKFFIMPGVYGGSEYGIDKEPMVQSQHPFGDNLFQEMVHAILDLHIAVIGKQMKCNHCEMMGTTGEATGRFEYTYPKTGRRHTLHLCDRCYESLMQSDVFVCEDSKYTKLKTQGVSDGRLG